VRATADNLRRLISTILTSGGSAAPEAGLVADHLVRANLMGHDSHGVGMIPTYVRHLVPGEPERIAYNERARTGIEVDATTWAEILAAAEAVGVARAEAAAMGA
jgi:LDH2 family malate/lactate/ureidoglycolate dehydrogenase